MAGRGPKNGIDLERLQHLREGLQGNAHELDEAEDVDSPQSDLAVQGGSLLCHIACPR